MRTAKKIAFAFSFTLLGAFASNFASPIYRNLVSEIYQDSYGGFVFKCDQAMREHFVAKMRIDQEPISDNSSLLAAAEIALLDCHEYDKLRKKLISLGLTDNDLSAMGLKVIEAREVDLREIVRIHEIRY